MTNHYAVKPEDLLADGVDSTIINGMSIRKGTVAAFLANADILEDKYTNAQQKQDAHSMLKELAPASLWLAYIVTLYLKTQRLSKYFWMLKKHNIPRVRHPERVFLREGSPECCMISILTL